MLSPGELVVNAMQDTATRDWSADLRVNKMDMARLLSQDWKKRVSGGLYGQLDMSGNAAGLQRAEGRLSLQQGELEALPILSKLPVGNSYPYRQLQLEHAEARLSYPHADAGRNIRRAWLLDDINIRGKNGMLLVNGHVLVDEDGTLGGTLHIGLPADIATLLAPEGTPLFGRLFHREGEVTNYFWLRLNLSGTLDDPQEDLSARLTTLVGDITQRATGLLGGLLSTAGAAAEKAEPGTEEEEEEQKEPAKQPSSPGNIINKAGGAAQDILNTGIRSLF